ncbi:Peptidase propeptide and YPEB domain [Mycobacterium tuberculosis]|nr:Peptidase propeptide and YPEB domain [Mycobacterium tuberculosis]
MKINARRMVTGRGLLVTVVAAGVLAGGGATAAVAAHDDGPAPRATPAAGDEPASRATPAGERHDDGAPKTAVSLARAADAALKAVPGTVAEIELDDEHGRTAWEVEVVAGNGDRRDVTVDAGDGRVLKNRADDRDDDDDDRGDAAALRGAKVTAPAAADAALRAVPGRVTSADFETEHGRAVWEVDVAGEDGAEHEVTVDAGNGGVLAERVDED